MSSAELPDVLFISVDTMRRDRMAPYGPDLMPAATRLLEEGVAFDRCIAPAPWTGPSFATMFSGLWPREHGFLANKPRRKGVYVRSPLRPDVRLLAEMLRDAGYHTVCSQGNDVYLRPSRGLNRGFAEYRVWLGDKASRKESGSGRGRLGAFRDGGFKAGLACLLDQARRMISHRKRRERPFMQTGEGLVSVALRAARKAPQGAPLFLWINFMDMHVPYCAPRRWMPPREAPGEIRRVHLDPKRTLGYELTAADKEYIRRRYDNTARYVNACIADLLLRWRGLRSLRSTITIFTSDHGEEFWDHGDNRSDPAYYTRGVEHGHTLFGEQIHVPLVIHWPEAGVTGRRVDGLVTLADLTPTVVELLALDEDTSLLSGKSLAPWVTSSTPPPGDDERIVFADSIHSGVERRAALSTDHKLVMCPETGERQFFAWGKEDPAEQTDLAGKPEHAATEERLAAAVAAWDAALSQRNPPPALTPEEDEQTMAQLRMLGYV